MSKWHEECFHTEDKAISTTASYASLAVKKTFHSLILESSDLYNYWEIDVQIPISVDFFKWKLNGAQWRQSLSKFILNQFW